LETQTEIAKSLLFGKEVNWKATDMLLNEVMKMLNVMTSKKND